MSDSPGLDKYLDLDALSERELYRLFDWDRPEHVTRKASLSELVGRALPPSLSGWRTLRASEAMLEAGKVIRNTAPADAERFRSVLSLLDGLTASHPEVLRTVVWPTVQALQGARDGGDGETAAMLERLLLRLSRAAPAVVVSGIVNVGNPRFRGASKKGGARWRKARIVGSIADASRVLREAFIDSVADERSRAGDPDTARTLAGISEALEAVVRACRAGRKDRSASSKN